MSTLKKSLQTLGSIAAIGGLVAATPVPAAAQTSNLCAPKARKAANPCKAKTKKATNPCKSNTANPCAPKTNPCAPKM